MILDHTRRRLPRGFKALQVRYVCNVSEDAGSRLNTRRTYLLDTARFEEAGGAIERLAEVRFVGVLVRNRAIDLVVSFRRLLPAAYPLKQVADRRASDASNQAPRPDAARDRSRRKQQPSGAISCAPCDRRRHPLAEDRSLQHRVLSPYGPAGIAVVLSTSTGRAGTPGARAYTPRLVYMASEVLE